MTFSSGQSREQGEKECDTATTYPLQESNWIVERLGEKSEVSIEDLTRWMSWGERGLLYPAPRPSDSQLDRSTRSPVWVRTFGKNGRKNGIVMKRIKASREESFGTFCEWREKGGERGRKSWLIEQRHKVEICFTWILLTTSTWLTWQEVILSMWSLLVPETVEIPFLFEAAFRV